MKREQDWKEKNNLLSSGIAVDTSQTLTVCHLKWIN